MKRVNQPADMTLQNVMANILRVGRERPIVIQSLFPMLNQEEPEAGEIDGYVHRLQELMAGGAQISLVQIYSAHRPALNIRDCGHLPLSRLSAHRPPRPRTNPPSRRGFLSLGSAHCAGSTCPGTVQVGTSPGN